jgi:hypothetical protein
MYSFAIAIAVFCFYVSVPIGAFVFVIWNAVIRALQRGILLGDTFDALDDAELDAIADTCGFPRGNMALLILTWPLHLHRSITATEEMMHRIEERGQPFTKYDPKNDS